MTAFQRELGFANLITILPTQLLDWKVFPELPQELTHYVIPTLQDESFNSALIHIGINDILKYQSDLQFESVTQNILEISQKYQEHGIAEIIITS